MVVEQDENRLRERALGLLARREHTQLELKQKLLAKGFLSSEVDRLLVTLTKEGLQSDERFAEAYVRRRADIGFGPRRIRHELAARGVSESSIQQVVLQDDAFWEPILALIWQKKYSTRRSLSESELAKQARFLLHRGFEPDAIYRWLREIKKGSTCQSE